MEPIPFDIESYINDYNKSQPTEKTADNRNAFASVFGGFTDPFIRQGYVTAAALNRGMAAFSAHLDGISGYIQESTGLEKGGLFEEAAKIYEDNAGYWQKRAEEVGAGFIDEIIGEAAGGLVPGVTQFTLDVASGLTFSYMDGAYQGYKKGESPFEKGMVEAARTGILAGLFKMTSPLKQYLRAPTMGTIFGLQESEVAPEGEKLKAFAKGASIGALYSVTSPGGRMGLNEVSEAVKPEAKWFAEKMADSAGRGADLTESEHLAKMLKDQTGSIFGEGKKRQRNFLKTTEESADIDPELKPRITEIEPQDYFVKPNAESFETARKMVAENPDAAEAFARGDTPPTAEKGAVLHELIKKYQSERNFDKAIEIIEEFDRQGRAAGQFIQTAAQWSKLLSPEGFIKWANRQLDNVSKKYSWADTLIKRKPEEFRLSKDEEKIVLEKYREINGFENETDRADATLELIDMVAQKVPPSVSELIDAYRYQNMLSSPKTHMRNIGYNQLAVFLARPWDLTTRAGIDYIKAGITGKQRKAYINDVPVYMKTALNALPNAVMAFKETLKLSRDATLEKPDLGIEAKTSFEQARTRQIPPYLTMVQRFMEACDKFNMALIGAGEYAINKKNGLNDAEALNKATATAQQYLLRSDIDPKNPDYSIPSKILADLYKMIESTRKAPVLGPIAKWYIPFLKTPMNLGINMIEYSPVGLVRTNLTETAASKLLAGGVVTALGATMAYMGETTWAPPSDPKEKELFYASGRKPYSVKMGDVWVPLWYLGPYALAFGLPAAIKYYTEDSKASMTADATEKIFDVSEGLARFIGSQSSTQSIGALFSALDGDIDYKLSSQTGFTLSQIIPGSAFVRYVNTIIDPVYRHPKGFVEKMENSLPVLSQGLDARMTPLFEVAKRDPVNYFLPYDIGVTTEPYNSMYEVEQIAIKNANEKKLEALIERMRENPMNIDKVLDDYLKIVSEGPDIKTRGIK